MILVACEYTQLVTKAFRDRGHEAYSCDLIDGEINKKWHIKGDVLEILSDPKWSLIIAFPPCTHLAVSGARWFAVKQKSGLQRKAISFFLKFVYNVPKGARVCIENPVGIMSTIYRPPDQKVHPYHFGDPYEKLTCLWLRDLPKLRLGPIVKPECRITFVDSKGRIRSQPKWYYETFMNKSKISDLSRKRSRIWPGLAKAMAEQWGRYA